jgi:hypothetical protein
LLYVSNCTLSFQHDICIWHLRGSIVRYGVTYEFQRIVFIALHARKYTSWLKNGCSLSIWIINSCCWVSRSNMRNCLAGTSGSCDRFFTSCWRCFEISQEVICRANLKFPSRWFSKQSRVDIHMTFLRSPNTWHSTQQPWTTLVHHP